MFDKPAIYAGIGSRETPQDIIDVMTQVGAELGRRDWVLRSGGAKGADTAFALGCLKVSGNKEIFKSEDAKEWAFKEAEKYIPSNRPPFRSWQPYVQGLIARNMMQVLGRDGDEPIKMVICWTLADKKDGGGTGYAMRCAEAYDIPVHNLHDEDTKQMICQKLEL